MGYEKWWGLALLLAVLPSCNEIFEENIEDERMAIMAPADGARLTATVTFLWDEMKGADRYHLQIVSPTFDSLVSLLQDTLVEGNRFVTSLSRGEYQWRIRGENSAYLSGYTTRSFTVDSTTDLSQQTLLVQFPPQAFTTNQTRVTFEWLPFDFADDYRFEVASPDFNGTVLLDVNLTVTTIAYTFDEGTYAWRIRAQNSSSNSAYTNGTLTIDTVPPQAPVLTSPVDNAFIQSDTVTLQWTTGSGGFYDTVYVYLDSSLAMPSQVIGSGNQSLQYINANDGEYFWRVRSTDEAGNPGPFSVSRKFTLQP